MNYMFEYCTTNANLSQYDVQSVLEEIMDQEFEAICDDNSITGRTVCIANVGQLMAKFFFFFCRNIRTSAEVSKHVQ